MRTPPQPLESPSIHLLRQDSVRKGGKGTPPPRVANILAIATAMFFAFAPDAFACPVCYGGASGSMIDGAKLSVIFLGALVYLVIGGGVAMFVVLRRRAIKNQDPRRGLHTVPRSNET